LENLNLSAQRLRDGLLFCGRIEWELGDVWIVATKKEKLQPNRESCNQMKKVATKT